MPWSTEQPSYPDSFDLAISAGYPFIKQILYYAELLLLNQYCFSLLRLNFLPLVKLKLTSLSNCCHFYVYIFLQHSASVWFLLLPAKFIITKQSYISAQTALFPEIWVAVRVRSSLLHVQESVCMCFLIFFMYTHISNKGFKVPWSWMVFHLWQQISSKGNNSLFTIRCSSSCVLSPACCRVCGRERLSVCMIEKTIGLNSLSELIM